MAQDNGQLHLVYTAMNVSARSIKDGEILLLAKRLLVLKQGLRSVSCDSVFDILER